MRWLFTLLLVAAYVWQGIDPVQAQSSASCASSGICDQGEAYSQCKAAVSNSMSYYEPYGGYPKIAKDCTSVVDSYGNGGFECVVHATGPSTPRCRVSGSDGGDSSKTFWFSSGKTCSARNVTTPAGDKSAGSPMPWPSCVAGCKIQQEQISYSQPGGVMLYGRRNATYLNETCTSQSLSQNGAIDTREEQPKPTEPECTALGGGQTSCFKSNGDHCATASTGKTFCWTPNETGKKIDGDDAQVKGKKGEPVTPPNVKIDNKDWQRKEGHQQTACINNTCTTYNVTNYQTAPAGSAKNSTGDNQPDGSGNTSGNGKPSKGDGKDGDKDDGDSATDSGNCDTPPICTGDTLKCLQLKFTWKIECNTKGNEITNGTGCGENDIPVCAGKSCKAEAYSQVLQQWKQRCSFEGDRDAAKGDARSGAADGAGDDLAGVVGGLWAGDGVTPTLNQNRLSIGGGNVIPDVDIMGTKVVMPQGFYDALAIIKKIIIAAAMIAAFPILWRR
ncbi:MULTISPECIES: hypothetical protein [Stenotrophomonas]|uniref:hypothetical protein n=1 Tax=Stenotrophomonas TaxID=40323 RepID=UPI00081C234C|nr:MULTISPECIES: hypothetical protein [Stenotrophomonas]